MLLRIFASIFVLPTVFLGTSISFAANISLGYTFLLLLLVHDIIGLAVVLYIVYFVNFLVYSFFQTRTFKQPATLAVL